MSHQHQQHNQHQLNQQLSQAAQDDNVELVEQLLAQGADITAIQDETNYTFLHCAVANDNNGTKVLQSPQQQSNRR